MLADPRLLLLLLLVGAGFLGGYSYTVWYRSIRTIGVAKAMALNITYVLWGILFAWLVQGRAATLLAVAGCLVVTGGACLTILSGRRTARGQPAAPRFA